MSLATFTKIAIATGNYVTPSGVTAVATTGITAFVTGFPASNLEYEDAWLLMKTSGVSGTVTVEHQFSASISPNVLGIMNHNLYSSGYSTFTVEKYDAGAWNSVAAITLLPGDGDLFIPWNSAGSDTRWRFNLGSAASDFYIGNVVYANYVTMSNPAPQGIIQRRAVPLVVEESAGGARHITFGAQKRSSSLEITWQRATMIDLSSWAQFGKYALIGILSTEQGDYGDTGVALGGEMFWGYVRDRTFSPRGPGGVNTDQQGRYDITLFLEGCV